MPNMGDNNMPTIPGDAAPTTKVDLSQIINLGDLGTMLTNYGIEEAMGGKGSLSKSGTQLAISVISRFLTQNLSTLSSLNGTLQTTTAKDLFVLTVVSMVAAYMQKRNNVPRAVIVSVLADVLSDRALSTLGFNENSSLFNAQ